jgi:hypothetical protein
MSIAKIPEDILDKIFSYIRPTEKTLNDHLQNIAVNALEKSQIKVLKKKKGCVYDEIVKRIVSYIKKIDQNEKDKIICDYGFAKGLRLFYNFHRHVGYSYSDICEYFELNDFPIDDNIIEVIFMKEIGIINDFEN